MSPYDLYVHIMRAEYPATHRAVLARIVLNAMYDAKQYPVDLSELCALGGSDYATARSFLEQCAVNPWTYGSAHPDSVIDWRRVLEKAQKEIAI